MHTTSYPPPITYIPLPPTLPTPTPLKFAPRPRAHQVQSCSAPSCAVQTFAPFLLSTLPYPSPHTYTHHLCPSHPSPLYGPLCSFAPLNQPTRSVPSRSSRTIWYCLYYHTHPAHPTLPRPIGFHHVPSKLALYRSIPSHPIHPINPIFPPPISCSILPAPPHLILRSRSYSKVVIFNCPLYCCRYRWRPPHTESRRWWVKVWSLEFGVWYTVCSLLDNEPHHSNYRVKGAYPLNE